MCNYFAIFRKIIIFASWYSAICWICSHTLRGCVDWNIWNPPIAMLFRVTPFVGVWIETRLSAIVRQLPFSHTLRGCVDWNCALSICLGVATRHTLRGCVDWNSSCSSSKSVQTGHTLRGCVDWNSIQSKPSKVSRGHTLRGCVDWNKNNKAKGLYIIVTPFVGVWIETAIYVLLVCLLSVTPFVGVWIETWIDGTYINLNNCHTLRGCVDWNSVGGRYQASAKVTPFVGVWIETWDSPSETVSSLVTPFVGVWIETSGSARAQPRV